jgi:hypothetical protein
MNIFLFPRTLPNSHIIYTVCLCIIWFDIVISHVLINLLIALFQQNVLEITACEIVFCCMCLCMMFYVGLCAGRRAQVSGAKSPRQVKFVWWLINVWTFCAPLLQGCIQKFLNSSLGPRVQAL